MPVFKIGVRELVEFTLRSGDLNTKLNSENTAKQGSRIHRQIQKQRGKNFNAEYGLKHQFQVKEFALLVHGRADGIIFKDQPQIEEIKTSDVPWEELPDNIKTLYWGQVQAYAGLLMLEQPQIDSVQLKLTYVQTPEQTITTNQQTIKKDDALQFLNQLLEQYQSWLALRAEIEKNTIQTAHQLKFPFPSYRPHQKKLAQVVYKTIYAKRNLLLEAPTGTGKTISTLFPAIKGLGEKQIRQIFYLTAKQSTRHVAEDALMLMQKKGLSIKSITITAKEQITFAAERDLAPENNPYMVGYYDRIKPALKEALANHDQFTKSVIETYAQKYQLDPFAFTLDLSEFCSVIICDYNYLFDPLIQLERFFKLSSNDKCYLIDEAHNLVDRSRDMYSTNLSTQELNAILKIINQKPQGKKRLIKQLNALMDQFNDYQNLLQTKHPKDHQLSFTSPFKPLNQQVNRLAGHLHKWFAKHDEKNDLNQKLLTFYFALIKWLRINELYDDSYRTRIIQEHGLITLRQFCINPSPFLQKTLKTGGSSILFSATLSPMNYYQRVLDNENDLLKYRIDSPFSPEHQLIIKTPFIKTTYHQRQSSLQPIAATIMAMLKGQPGHYLIFLPSFFYLKKVSEQFKNDYPKVKTVIQNAVMSNKDRRDFLERFKEQPQKPLVGFAILGGLFSEGIDLKGTQLIGVGIVSVGLPAINPETNLVAEYFDQDQHRGFEYAYQLPGWNHVVQAAGRVIRTTSDQGIIVLMDARFSQWRYQQLFPTNWQYQIQATNPNQVNSAVAHFWQNKKASD